MKLSLPLFLSFFFFNFANCPFSSLFKKLVPKKSFSKIKEELPNVARKTENSDEYFLNTLEDDHKIISEYKYYNDNIDKITKEINELNKEDSFSYDSALFQLKKKLQNSLIEKQNYLLTLDISKYRKKYNDLYEFKKTELQKYNNEPKNLSEADLLKILKKKTKLKIEVDYLNGILEDFKPLEGEDNTFHNLVHFLLPKPVFEATSKDNEIVNKKIQGIQSSLTKLENSQKSKKQTKELRKEWKKFNTWKIIKKEVDQGYSLYELKSVLTNMNEIIFQNNLYENSLVTKRYNFQNFPKHYIEQIFQVQKEFESLTK